MKNAKNIEKTLAKCSRIGYAMLCRTRFGGEMQVLINQLVNVQKSGPEYIGVVMCGFGFLCGLMANKKEVFEILIKKPRQ